MSAKCEPGDQALNRKAGPTELLLGPKFASGPANAGINTYIQSSAKGITVGSGAVPGDDSWG